MSSNEDVVNEVVGHALTESAVAVAVRTIIGRVGHRGHSTQERIAERFCSFARGAANLALIDDGLRFPDMSESCWRQRLANENAARLSQLFAAQAFIDRYVLCMLNDELADVSPTHTGLGEAFGIVFNVVTQVTRMQVRGLDPMLLPQPTVLTPHDVSGSSG